jgi:hypothetical protein
MTLIYVTSLRELLKYLIIRHCLVEGLRSEETLSNDSSEPL